MKKLICPLCEANNVSEELKAITEFGLLDLYKRHLKKDHPQEFMKYKDMTKDEKDTYMNQIKINVIDL